MNPAYLRIGVGLLLIGYSIYGLVRPTLKPSASVPVELGVGFLNGVLGGMTGLAGIIVTIWCQLRGWSKDVQRIVFQPVILAALLMSAASLAAIGAITTEAVKLFLLRPAGAAGRHLDRAQTLRKARRRRLPQGDPGAAAGVRTGADRPAIDFSLSMLAGASALSYSFHVGPTAVAPRFQGLRAQAPSPSFTEGTYAVSGFLDLTDRTLALDRHGGCAAAHRRAAARHLRRLAGIAASQ